MERKTIRKWWWVWQFEREELWLNTMAQEGWVLSKVGFCTYHFTRCEPGEYTVRLEMHGKDKGYLRFMEELGAEFVGSYAQWLYFRRKTVDGPFDIFSDIDSRIAHLDNIGKSLSVVGGANLVIGLANTINPMLNIGWLNLLCATLVMYCVGRIHGKKESLEKERMLRE